MPRRTRFALAAAGCGVIAIAITWYAAHYLPAVRTLDADVLTGFESLRRPWLDRVARPIATLCNPMPYVLLAAVPVGLALARRRQAGWRLAAVIAAMLLGANETTEVLKPLLAAAHDPVVPIQPSDVSFPSGHATASMALALALVLVAPARRRGLVATATAGFAVAVCWSFLEQGWHYPSDVLGGYLVAGTWTLLGVAVLGLLQAHRPLPATPTVPVRLVPSLGAALGPPIAAIGLGMGALGLLALARPHAALAFARAHELLGIGAGTIAVSSLALASGLSLMLRRPS